jgi:hypothetical protein
MPLHHSRSLPLRALPPQPVSLRYSTLLHPLLALLFCISFLFVPFTHQFLHLHPCILYLPVTFFFIYGWSLSTNSTCARSMLSHPPSGCVSACLKLGPKLTAKVYMSTSMCLFLCVYFYMSISICLFLYVYFYTSSSICLFLYVHFCMSISLCLFLDVYFYMPVSICLLLYVCLYMSISICLFLYVCF